MNPTELKNIDLKQQVTDLTKVTIRNGNTIANLRHQLKNALNLLHISDQLIHTLKRKAVLAVDYDHLDLFELVDEWLDCLEDGDTQAAADVAEWAVMEWSKDEWEHEVKDRETLFDS